MTRPARWLLATSLLLLGPTGCGDKRCCRTADCSKGNKLSGSDVLQFRGDVPKNLLFLSFDTTRRDHMGFLGNDKGLTPFLDRIAEEGVVMEDHLQCSNWTFGSTTCTLAGRTNVERGHLPRLNGKAKQRPPVPEDTPFLATWLGEAGFDSMLITANAWMSEKNGNTQGYDYENLTGGTAEELILEGRDKLRGRTDHKDPWFLHVHMMEPHAAYNPPEKNVELPEGTPPWTDEDLRKRKQHYGLRDQWGSLAPEERDLLEIHLRALYEGEIRTLDERMEAAFNELDEDCWLDDTLVVFWSDHGEAFWEHGFNTHAYNLTAEENDGILVFWAKNIEPRRYQGTTSTTDLVATLLDLYGVDIPKEVTGYPIGTAPDDRPIFTEALARTGGVQAVVRDGMKLQYHWGSGAVRVWDRESDRQEMVNIYNPNDPVVLELWSLLKPQVEAMAPLVVNQDPSPVWPPDLP